MRLSSLLLPLRTINFGNATFFMFVVAVGAFMLAPYVRSSHGQTALSSVETPQAKSSHLDTPLPSISHTDFVARFSGIDAVFYKTVPDNVQNAVPKTVPTGKTKRQVLLDLERVMKISFPQEV